MKVCYNQFISEKSGKKYMALECCFGDYFKVKVFPNFEAPYLKRYIAEGSFTIDVPEDVLVIEEGTSKKNGKPYTYVDIPTIGKMKERVFLNRYTCDLVQKYLTEVSAK